MGNNDQLNWLLRGFLVFWIEKNQPIETMKIALILKKLILRQNMAVSIFRWMRE